MATTPRGPNTPKRTTSRAKKPTTIDLEASEVKSTTSANKSASGKTTPEKGDAVKFAKQSSNAATAATGKTSTTPSVGKSTSKSTATGKPVKSDVGKKPDNTKAKSPEGSLGKPSNSGNGNSGFGKLAAAGIVGGLVTLAGAGTMQYNGLLPSIGSAPTNTQSAPAMPPVDLAPLEAKITQLQDKLDNLTNTQAPTIDLTPIETRIAALENAPPAAGGENVQSAATEQLQKLETGLDTLTKSTSELSARFESLENAEPSAPDNNAISALIDSAIAPVIASAKQNSTQFGELKNQVSALTRKIDEEVEARISKFDEKLKNAATGEKLAKSVAINALKSALTNGEPFSAALVSLETLAGPSEPLESLKPYATTGISTGKILLNEFRDLQSAIVLAASSNPEAGLSDRLMSSIRSLVTITSDEALPGDSPEAIVSRIAANLKSGNFETAAGEWKALPDQSRQISKSWMEKLSLRMEADRQMIELLQIVQSPTGTSDG
ncbi:MAG: hypothetical protein L3J32_03140 [Rhizobiaceae bacterium]|nr:hypothetical protein [Rhizobiaceae bacterium]